MRDRGPVSGFALPARLEGRAALIAVAAWVIVAVLLVAAAAVGFVHALRTPDLVAIPALVDVFRLVGLDDRLMIVVALLLPYVVVVTIATIVVARRARDPVALLFTMLLLALFTYSSRTLLTYDGVPLLEHAVSAVFALGVLCLAVVLAVFPDGRVVPGHAVLLPVAMLVLLVVVPDVGARFMGLLDRPAASGAMTLVPVLAFAGVLVAGVAAQWYRYRHVSDLTQRQQAKWAVTPLVLLLVATTVVLVLVTVVPDQVDDVWLGWFLLLLTVPGGILLPLAVANAVWRHRLHEIDRIISRTVAYGLVVAFLGAMYVGGVVTIGGLLAPFADGAYEDVAVAVTVLALVGVFRPVRQRVLTAVDRRFNRTRHEAGLVLDAFVAGLRDEVDLDAIRRDLVAAAATAFEPDHASVWFPPSRTHP